MKYTPEVGSWIRFYKGGNLVISEVRYIVRTEVSWASRKFITDDGEVYDTEESVLECRRKEGA